ncbi:MAG: RluA family pseudouridine synthase [Polyangiaceae bacterium]
MSAGRTVLVAERKDAGSRLDRFVVEAMAREGAAVSRAELQRWIEHGRVTVWGRARKASEKVREGDVVEIEPEAPARSSAEPDAGVPFEVLYVDDAVVVVNKPPGVVVHPARGHEGGTLVNGLLALGLFDAAVLEGDERDAAGYMRPGIVHRLDKGTSGVLVVARTGEAREKLKAQFHAHTMGRQYVGLCAGDVASQTIATLHGRHPTDRLRFTSRVTTGKRAVTHVRPVERFGVATYVACTLETGRTHQIRMHLAETGTPILGDTLYGRPPKDPRVRAVADALGHQALHARLLAFVHPTTGEMVRFEAPPPEDFTRALEALRRIAVPAP